MDGLTSPEDWHGWIPTRFFWPEGANEPSLEWCFAGDQRPTSSFYDFDITTFYTDPANALFRRIEPMSQLLSRLDGTEPDPAGFIFHSARTGSTLVSQMLAVPRRHTVASEPHFLSSLLRLRSATPDGVSDEQGSSWLRSSLRALAASGSPLIVKFGAEAISHFATVRAAFPETPCIFLYREPLEVLQSIHQKPLPSSATVRGQDLGRIATAELGDRMRAAILAARQAEIWLVNYTELPGFVGDQLVHHFALDVDDATLAEMTARAERRGKHPGEAFKADSERKRADASADVIEAARELQGLYAELEELRLEQSSTAGREDDPS